MGKEAGLNTLAELRAFMPEQLQFGREILRHNQAVFGEGWLSFGAVFRCDKAPL